MSEVDSLAIQAQTGDQAARTQLYERYLPLIRRSASRHVSRATPREDLEQEGALALLKALKTFDPAKGSFAGRAMCYVRRAMYWYALAGESFCSLVCGVNFDQMAKAIEDKDFIAAPALDSLSDRERQAIISYYGLMGREPATQEEIGAALGLSQNRASEILKGAISKLRRLSDE